MATFDFSLLPPNGLLARYSAGMAAQHHAARLTYLGVGLGLIAATCPRDWHVGAGFRPTVYMVLVDPHPLAIAHGLVTLKCSTWSGGRGCVDEDHFRGSPAATEDKICQAVGVVPYPIPTIAQ